MTKDTLTAFLQSTKLVSFAAATEIAGRFDPKTIAKNQYQLTAGKICDEYLISCHLAITGCGY